MNSLLPTSDRGLLTSDFEAENTTGGLFEHPVTFPRSNYTWEYKLSTSNRACYLAQKTSAKPLVRRMNGDDPLRGGSSVCHQWLRESMIGNAYVRTLGRLSP